MKTVLVFILSLVFFTAIAQTRATSFALIDKRVKTIHSSNPDTLSQKLTSPYKTDIEKIRSIFRWITENISYDTKGYHDTNGVYEDLWQSSLNSDEPDKKRSYNKKIIQKVLKEKRAVCDGYARLFKTLCDYAKIKNEIITGYIRWASDPIGKMTNRGHAWNTVYINGSWKLVDATWASGYVNPAVTEFTKSYNEFFFFTDPVAFFNDHYPTDNKWSLLPSTPGLNQFYNFPFYYSSFYKFKITSVKPATGYIEVSRKKKLVQIELETSDLKKEMFVYESPYQTPEIKDDSPYFDSLQTTETADYVHPNYKIEKNRITYSYEIQSDKAQKLNIVYNGKLILTYGITFME